MLITDVINEVKRYHSFDLDERELYMWCNEVGLLLRRGGCDKTAYAPIRLICYRGEAYIDPEKSSIRLRADEPVCRRSHEIRHPGQKCRLRSTGGARQPTGKQKQRPSPA